MANVSTLRRLWGIILHREDPGYCECNIDRIENAVQELRALQGVVLRRDSRNGKESRT